MKRDPGNFSNNDLSLDARHCYKAMMIGACCIAILGGINIITDPSNNAVLVSLQLVNAALSFIVMSLLIPCAYFSAYVANTLRKNLAERGLDNPRHDAS
jgi:hypothetical protein